MFFCWKALQYNDCYAWSCLWPLRVNYDSFFLFTTPVDCFFPQSFCYYYLSLLLLFLFLFLWVAVLFVAWCCRFHFAQALTAGSDVNTATYMDLCGWRCVRLSAGFERARENGKLTHPLKASWLGNCVALLRTVHEVHLCRPGDVQSLAYCSFFKFVLRVDAANLFFFFFLDLRELRRFRNVQLFFFVLLASSLSFIFVVQRALVRIFRDEYVCLHAFLEQSPKEKSCLQMRIHTYARNHALFMYCTSFFFFFLASVLLFLSCLLHLSCCC